MRNFKPESQDVFAVYKMMEKGVIQALLEDRFADAVQAGSSEWASFPDKNEGEKGDVEKNPKSRFTGQPAAPLSWLEDKYNKALGK